MPEVDAEMVIHHALELSISSSDLLETVSAVRTNLSGSQRGASASCGKHKHALVPRLVLDLVHTIFPQVGLSQRL